MKPIMNVLMVGVETNPEATNPQSSGRDYKMMTAKVCSDLVAVAVTESICAAVLNPDLPLDELARYAQAVRWGWPAARIFLVRAEAPNIGDALYDERLQPGLSPELLIAAVDGIIDSQRRPSERMRLWEC